MTDLAPITPRMVNKSALVAYLGLSRASFDRQLPRLEALGFPDKTPGVERYDLKIVDEWLDGLGNRAQLRGGGIKRSAHGKNAFK